MVIGQNFHLRKVEDEFICNVESWINYLNITDLFPNFTDFKDKAYEIGDKLRDFGKSKVFGLAGNRAVFFRPGDYAAMLHEITHANPDIQGKLLSTEAGCFALGIYVAGDFDGELNSLLSSCTYNNNEKMLGRFVAEASITAGRYVFDALKQIPSDARLDDVLLGLNSMVKKAEEEFIKGSMTPEEYLERMHGLTPFVAQYLLNTTQDTKETIVRSTSQTKKEVIGAFKSLVSFYHINLNYPLADALNRTEEHFDKDEALTIQKTLMKGAKDVFAKMTEYGYDIETCRAIAENMITQGTSKARMYAKGLPSFLELTGGYGPRGEEILDFALRNPRFLESMVFTDGASGLLELAENEPEQVPKILSELSRLNWDRQVSDGTYNLDYMYRNYAISMMNMDTDEKAKMAAHSLYIGMQGRKEDYGLDCFSNNIANIFKELMESKKGQKMLKVPEVEKTIMIEAPETPQLEEPEQKPKGLLARLFPKK